MAEWSKAAVLKTVEPQGSGGSNPSLSAKIKNHRKVVFYFKAWINLHMDLCSKACSWADSNPSNFLLISATWSASLLI